MPAKETAPMLPGTTRIVTGHDGKGNVIIERDSVIVTEATSCDGLRGAPIWITNDTPARDNNNKEDGANRELGGLCSPNGTNHRMTDLAPGAITPMHRTSSLDYNILISGEVALVFEDGTERHLKNPGDVVVQKGTMHAWRNPGKTWCRWISVLVDAEPVRVNGRVLEDAWLE